jgi:hypothetical protein
VYQNLRVSYVVSEARIRRRITTHPLGAGGACGIPVGYLS